MPVRKSVEIGTTHEVTALRADKFALLVHKFVPAARTPTPRLVLRFVVGHGLFRLHGPVNTIKKLSSQAA